MMDPIASIRTARWGSYLVAFFITALIFATALYVSNYFNDRRLAEIQATQDNISIDILSIQTQFDLLKEHACADIAENSILSNELQPLGSRLAYLEQQQNVNQEELARLKRYYSLLEIKDYLLMQEVAAKCGLKPVVILYFYSNQGDCDECEHQGYALTGISQKYPGVRIYSFDYNLGLSALRTLTEINSIQGPLPALVIKNKVHYGLKTVEDIEKILPELAKMSTTTSRR